ncbi:MAG TPA: hypothetical protein VL860_06910, partial [Planctomycetota bacterium]|nr:hypothetical protein [Planctomycetota bacterium]
LADRNCPGFHLGVNAANQGACKFYEAIGLGLIRQTPQARTYGRVLSKQPCPPAGAPIQPL